MFPDLTTFMCFERLVPDYHWHRIKSIGIAWDYEVRYDFQYPILPCPTNEQTWKDVCRSISKMEGIQLLRVDLIRCPRGPHHHSGYELSQPLREITNPAVFEYFVFKERDALAGRCGCGCGRAEGFHGSGPFDRWSVVSSTPSVE